MKNLLALLTMIALLLVGSAGGFCADKSMGCRLLSSTEGDAGGILENCVNALNGDYCEVDTDLVVDGPDALVIQRYYNSHDYVTGCKPGGWRIYPESLLVVGKDPKHQRCVVGKNTFEYGYAYTGERSGGILCYSGWRNLDLSHDLKVDIARHNIGVVNTSSAGMGGCYFAGNNVLHFDPGSNSYQLTSGDGRVRIYQRVENPPEDLFGSEEASSLTEKVIEPQYFLLTTELLSSGNKLFYTYGQTGELTGIELKSSDEERILGWLSFESRISDGKGQILVTSSDNRTIQYHFNQGFLKKVSISDRPEVSYQYSAKGLLSRRDYPDNHYLIVDYDEKERVVSLAKPLGTAYTLAYQPNTTIVADALGHQKLYHYDSREQLTAIEYIDEGKVWKGERRFWGSGKDSGKLMTQSLERDNGQTVACTTYGYDDYGNVVEEQFYGNLTGIFTTPITLDKKGLVIGAEQTDCQIKRCKYSTDDRNLLIWSGDEKGNSTRYRYVEGTSLLAAELYLETTENTIRKRCCYFYDDNAVLVRKVVDDGFESTFRDRDFCYERHITEIIPKADLPGLGLPTIIEEKYLDREKNGRLLSKQCYRYDEFGREAERDIYDSDDIYRYTLYKEYDARGNLIKETDPNGNTTFLGYDINDRCQFVSIPYQQIKVDFVYDEEDHLVEKKEVIGDQNFSSQFTYDRLGNITHETDRYGSLFQYLYDERGHLITTIEPETIDEKDDQVQPTWHYTYNCLGQVLSMTNPKGHVTRIKRNIRGKPLQITYPDGSEECLTYDAEGSLHRSRDRDGIVTSYAYDTHGRLQTTDWSSIHNWGCGPWTYNRTYTHNNFHLTFSKENEMKTKYDYDKAGRLIQICQQDFLNKVLRHKELAYDSLNRESEEKIWYGNEPNEFGVEKHQYDLLGNLIESNSLDSQGSLWTQRSYAYNSHGQRIDEKVIVDGQERSLGRVDYNPMGDPISLIDSAGDKVKIAYDYARYNDFGHRVMAQTVTNPRGIVTHILFDNRKRPVEITTKDSSQKILAHEVKKYDIVGNLVHEVHDRLASDGSRFGQVHTEREYGPMDRLETLAEFVCTAQPRKTLFTYTPSGRLQEKRLEGEEDPFVRYTYREDGRVGSIIWGKDQTQKLEYDQFGFVRSITAGTLRTSRKYNAGGELLEEEVYDSDARKTLYKLTYTYDQKGRLTSIGLPDKSKILYEYGPFACTAIRRISNEGRELYAHHYLEYDALGRLQIEQLIGWAGNRIHEWNPGGFEQAILTDFINLGIPLQKRDSCGNILSVKCERDEESQEQAYIYDLLDRLIGEHNHTYDYDSLNHRLSKDSQKCQINDKGELISASGATYSYDRLGFLIEKNGPQGAFRYHYESSGNLASVSTGEDTLVSFGYDGFGRRIYKNRSSTDKKIYFYIGDQELGCLDASGNIENLRIPGVEGESLSLQSVAIELEGKVYAPLHDFSGNVIALVDPEERQIVESYVYSAFGEESLFDEENQPISSSGVGNPWRYAEKRVDEEIGLIFFGKRYYDPSTGQWTTPDPSGFIDGPNLYAYAQNNPLSYIDPFGLSTSHRDNLKNCQPHEHDRYFFKQRGTPSARAGAFAAQKGAGSGLFAYDDHFEERYTDQIALRSYHYLPSNIYDLKRPELSNGLGIGFINGINNSIDNARGRAELLSAIASGYNIHGVYNATHGTVANLYECKLGLESVATPPVRLLHQMWDDYFDRAPEESTFLMVCHSQGAIHVRNALVDYSKEKRDRIIVVAIAPAAYIGREICKQAYHYVSPRDPVPKLDKEGRKRAGDTVIELKRHSSIPWYDFLDHSFDSMTYRESLERDINQYING